MQKTARNIIGLVLASALLVVAPIVRAGVAQSDTEWVYLTGQIDGASPLGVPVKIVVTLKRTGEGARDWAGSLDIAPAPGVGGAADQLLGQIEFTGQRLAFSSRLGAGGPGNRFELPRRADGEYEGLVLVGGTRELPVRLARADAGTARSMKMARPQRPWPPFEYDESEVTIRARDSVKLAGTLVTPAGDGPWPLVVMVSGEGPHDRDHSVAGHRPFMVIADALARRGVASARFDDPGVGASGQRAMRTPRDQSRDTADIVRELSADPRFAGASLLSMGSGSVIAALAAEGLERWDTRLDGLILLNPQGLPAVETLVESRRARFEGEGESSDYAEGWLDLWRVVLDRASDPKAPTDGVLAAARAVAEYEAGSRRGDGSTPDAGTLDRMTRRIAGPMLTPSRRDWLALDPTAALARVRVPVYVLTGSLDRTHPPALHLPAIRAALADAEGADERIRTLEGLNHLLQPALSGFDDETFFIPETIDERALARIAEWTGDAGQAPSQRSP